MDFTKDTGFYTMQLFRQPIFLDSLGINQKDWFFPVTFQKKISSF